MLLCTDGLRALPWLGYGGLSSLTCWLAPLVAGMSLTLLLVTARVLLQGGWGELGLPCCWGAVRWPRSAAVMLVSTDALCSLCGFPGCMGGRKRAKQLESRGTRKARGEQAMGCQEEHPGVLHSYHKAPRGKCSTLVLLRLVARRESSSQIWVFIR